MKKRNIVLLVALALVCILGVELAACRHFAPQVYESITAPVRRGAAATAAFCSRTISDASDWAAQRASDLLDLWEDITAPDADSPDRQLASEPALEPEVPVSDPSVTELREVDGRQVLTGGTYKLVYYNQSEQPWADLPYGSDDIGRYGCGPVAMAMAVSSMTDQEIDPSEMAQWAVKHGHWARRSGSYLSIVTGTAAAFGLEAQPLTDRTPEAVREALLSGDLLVALMGPGHFTTGGHFILIRATTLSGDVLVADPNSTERSLTPWDPQLILDELSASVSNGAPLWVLSQSNPS